MGFKDWMFGSLDTLILKKLLVYKSCLKDKMIKRTFKAKECLELVHTDMCGHFNVHAWRLYGYTLGFGIFT